MYLVIAEEEQGAVVHQFPGFSVFRLRHVPEVNQNNAHCIEVTSCTNCKIWDALTFHLWSKKRCLLKLGTLFKTAKFPKL